MSFFNKNKADTDRFVLYKPEPPNTDIHSKWRKPSSSYLENKRAKTQQLSLLKTLIKLSSVLNVALGVCVFCALIMLVFFTDYERIVFDDGTYLSCIIEPDGSIVTEY
ncbi:hypothetical protein ACTXIV_12190 [Psychrobacter celer]|uniref:hypothetical protein n=1 Tax=Psychrobacter celer TaxID=306572 RepID=UPI003FD17A21